MHTHTLKGVSQLTADESRIMQQGMESNRKGRKGIDMNKNQLYKIIMFYRTFKYM